MNKLTSVFLCSVLLTSTSFSTQAILKHKATLRRDASSTHPPIAILTPPDDVEVIDASPTRSYYHVRTAEGQEGWIYGRTLQIIPDNPAPGPNPAPAPNPHPTPSPIPPPGGIASTVPSNWDRPDPNQTQYEGVDGSCGPTGDGGDSFTNQRKNRTDTPASYHEVSWKALQALPYPNASTSLASWTQQQLAAIKPYEGIPVTVVGYLTAIKVEDRGSGESTNCHFTNPEEVDWHMPLVEHAGDNEATSIVVETTPRVRQTHTKWTPANLASWVASDSPVRISGWTLLDPEHKAHLGKFRSTLWEVHPITKIEVFKDGQWVDLDSLP